jgi:hypothetical protein
MSIGDMAQLGAETFPIQPEQRHRHLSQIVSVMTGWKFARTPECVGGLHPKGR